MKAKLTVDNYKSIHRADLELSPGLKVLVGPNGSGKTCVLSSLHFLRDVLRSGAALAVARQGGQKRVYRHGTKKMHFSICAELSPRTFRRAKAPCKLHWSVAIQQAGEESIATIVEESLRISARKGEEETTLFELELLRGSGKRDRISVRLADTAMFGRDLFSDWPDEFSRVNKDELAKGFIVQMKQRASKYREEPDRSYLQQIATYDAEIRHLLEMFTHLNEFNISPTVARASTEQLPFARMAPNGEGVAEVIDALQNQRFHKLEQTPLFDSDGPLPPWINPYYRYRYRFKRTHASIGYRSALGKINGELAAGVAPITGVSVAIDPTNGRRFVVFTSKDDQFSPEEVSDGTVKWLCILVSLYVPFSAVYLLEEPENFLHPWMQQRLIEIMRERAAEEGTVFILSSHSATVLNALHPEEILVVRQDSHGSRVSVLDDLDSVREVLESSQFHLGDLWISGAIGGIPPHA